MSRVVVGIEGRGSSAVWWGAAAISDGGRLVNSLTGLAAVDVEISELTAAGHLQLFERSVSLDAAYERAPLVVVVVDRSKTFGDLFYLPISKLTGLAGYDFQSPRQIYVFSDESAFESYAATVKTVILGKFLATPDDFRDAVRLGLTLSPGDPELNAARAFSTGNSTLGQRLARACVRPGKGREAFDLFLSALAGQGTYQLDYEDGVASKGFDIDVAAHQLESMTDAENKIIPFLKKQYAFIPRFEHSNFEEYKAASAHFTFKVDVPGQSLAQRVARYLLLYTLQEALSKRTPEFLADSPGLTEALNAIVEPGPGTRLTHSLIVTKTVEELTPTNSVVAARTLSPEIAVLGFVSGLQKDTKVEITIFPEFREIVSATDDGTGEPPRGIEKINGEGSFLRQPCVIRLRREGGRSERFWLSSIEWLGLNSSATIDSFPSSIVHGAFVTGQSIEVSLAVEGVLFVSALLSPDGTLVGEPLFVPGATRGTLEDSLDWINQFASTCRKRELAVSKSATWLPPVFGPAQKPVIRILDILSETGWSAPRPVVRDLLRKKFRLTFSEARLDKIVTSEDEYLRLADGNIEPTQTGKAMLEVYRKAVHGAHVP